ncbi:acetyl-CoA hydrolase/transferase family protein [Bordetella bronchiseptica]|uniref:acetyl-CoA hydrolase/transferase family protein n=1 Tax=Bordetella bronchiseptica TaxID=518 RepID=UPI00046112B5|nr:acetyl-CoA hydrolase/transferase C-terminal domain-containing protein [Bordetella bronchiseptica]AWP78297.1 acetyl-CoA hydrolase [Bordetella bronchiseptica]KAB1448818.1 acetyl-CoA hydrolase/transferase family protein [Bordetella bronchiseptica]KAB1575079.1 acetyl-CoA hydrolase/transferase family protein [Bordetella bronchiseptica]KDC63324.1 putative 4-hydroxybutyrate coenzyme A transferase [Bordetella bronchiseptica MBORD595]KDC76214.1 putative 4-hydroxybutyrate coenzyme A transferase [Bord
MEKRLLIDRLQGLLRAGDALWWGQATAEPLTLTRAVTEHRHALAHGGRLKVFVGIGASDTLHPGLADAIDFFGYTASGTHRKLAQAGVLDIVPSHYSQLPALIRAGVLPADVVLLQVSPPDEDGRYSLGLVHEYLTAALQRARVVIAEVSPEIPWTHGSVHLRAGDFDLLVDAAHPPLDAASAEPGPVERAIAGHIAAHVQDGSTLQVGIGKLPEAVLSALYDRRDLGLHTGAAGDGIVALAEAGALTNARKGRDEGVGVAGVLTGGARLRKWAHRNPRLMLQGTDYTHDPQVLASLNQLVAINSAVEVDLTGQVNAEVAGGVYVGALGGAVDFLRGAARSKGGVPIVALPATAKGSTRIVAQLSGPVSTPRCDAGLIVTEHGVADLRGLSLSRRVRCMLDIAAPEHRAELERQAHEALARCGAAFA